MVLLRKISTAMRVLREYGLKETVGLFRDNISKLVNSLKGMFSHPFKKLSYKAKVRKETNPDFVRILFVTTNAEATLSQTVRYRINNLREALEGKAYTRLIIIDKDKSSMDFLVNWADIIVIMRTIYIPKTEELLNRAKCAHKPVVFDIDDIIFLMKYAKNYCKVIGDSSQKMLQKQKLDFNLFERTYLRCNYATASTNFIVEKMKADGKKAAVIHNGFNKTQLDIADKALLEQQKDYSLSYLSGTKTHDKDFEQALPAIIRIMKEYPELKLKVAGYLDLSVLPKEFEDRVISACYMSWERLMKYGSTNYINLAPLDINNEFCHAKSELKYFEAALVKVPTVASSTDTFKRAIINGENGFLASNEEEWYNAIKKLLDDKEFYNNMCEKARKSAIEYYSPDHISDEALEVYKFFIDDYKKKLDAKKANKR